MLLTMLLTMLLLLLSLSYLELIWTHRLYSFLSLIWNRIYSMPLHLFSSRKNTVWFSSHFNHFISCLEFYPILQYTYPKTISLPYGEVFLRLLTSYGLVCLGVVSRSSGLPIRCVLLYLIFMEWLWLNELTIL